MAPKKSAKPRNVNKQGQRWTEDRIGMTLRLPAKLKESVIEEARIAGDLSRIVLFAMAHVHSHDVLILQTRKTGLGLANPMLLHIGAKPRIKLRKWAQSEGVSVNAIVVSVLEEFFRRMKKSRALKQELRQHLREARGL